MWQCRNCEIFNSGESCIICDSRSSNKIKDAEFKIIQFDRVHASVRNDESAGLLPSDDKSKKGIKTEFITHRTGRIKGIGDTADTDTHIDDTYVPHIEKKSNKKKIILILIVTIVLIAVLSVALLEVMYSKAKSQISVGNYTEARKLLTYIRFYRDADELYYEAGDEALYDKAMSLFESGNYDRARACFDDISYYRDSHIMVRECDYNKALGLLTNNSFSQAKEIFRNLSYEYDYKDCGKMVDECTYREASYEMDQGNYDKAYDLCSELGDYEGSKKLLNDIKDEIYEQGRELYKKGSYSEAKEKFRKSSDVGREEDYITLIEAHETTLSNVSSLYRLINFEDTKELLLSDKYIRKFLLGRWETISGDKFIEYYAKNGNKDDIWCTHSLPVESGKHYKLENGKHHIGDNESGWKKQWSYTIMAHDKIEVHNFNDNRIYTFYRK